MAAMSDFLENWIRAYLFRTNAQSFSGQSAGAKPGGLWVSLHTADPTDVTATAIANEVSGGSYARVARAPLDANWTATSSTDGVTTNAAAVPFPAPTADWGSIGYFGIWDASSTGNLLIHGALTQPKTVNNNDAAPSFGIGAVSVTFNTNMSDYLEQQLRTHLFRTGTFTRPTGLWVSLHTADPTDVGTGAEVSGGDYARVSKPPLDANWSAVSATDGITKNAVAVTFPSPTANWGVVTHFGIWDSVTTGNLLVHGSLGTSKTIANLDPAPSFAIDAITITLA